MLMTLTRFVYLQFLLPPCIFLFFKLGSLTKSLDLRPFPQSLQKSLIMRFHGKRDTGARAGLLGQ